MRICFTVLLICVLVQHMVAQNQPLGEWTFHPNYTLKRNAKNYPGNQVMPPKTRFQKFQTYGPAIYVMNERPTQRLVDVIGVDTWPESRFTLEAWINNHVNMPVGLLIAVRSKAHQHPTLALGYYGNEINCQILTTEGVSTASHTIDQGWKKYWGHIVMTYDQRVFKLYFNGVLEHSVDTEGQLLYENDTHLEMAGYFGQEPYMVLANMLKKSRFYDKALSPKEINERFLQLQEHVENGTLMTENFHFNAGPYLHYATQNSINLLWETNQRSTATVEYGTTLPMTEQIRIDDPGYILETTLDGLQTNTPYYYQIHATSTYGDTMSSGVLTFGTAVEREAPVSFCIIGDTESRPHINYRLAELIWDERPHFVMHLGDITDGGWKPHKFEWNYEYFAGITPLASRIPFFPVAGNGEGDLYWYNRYHRLPDPEEYYTFKYGNAQFFMLNSNDNTGLLNGGVQYNWLKEELTKSKATWKFVAHHHCPISSDENDFGNTWRGEKSTQGDPKFDEIKKLYESGGVDVVFYGHVHAYERSYPLTEGKVDAENGVTYIMSGGAGGHLEDFAPTNYTFSNRMIRGNHYLSIHLFKDKFQLRMVDTEGRLKDVFEMAK